MSKRPLIIDRPEMQTSRQRYAFAALTLVFWIVWFYLWTPLVTLVAWLFGAERFYQTMIGRSGFDTVLELIGLYALIILTMAVALGGWAWYNQLRVRGREKRRGSTAITPAEVDSFFLLEQGQSKIARRARHVVIEHDEDGRVLDIKERGRRD